MGAGVKACMETKHHVDEEPYEVNLDNYGCRSGAKAGRLRSLSNVSSPNEYLVHLQIGTQITMGINRFNFPLIGSFSFAGSKALQWFEFLFCW